MRAWRAPLAPLVPVRRQGCVTQSLPTLKLSTGLHTRGEGMLQSGEKGENGRNLHHTYKFGSGKNVPDLTLVLQWRPIILGFGI